METEDTTNVRPAGALPGRTLARQLIIAVELAIAVPIVLSVILGSLAEKRALVQGIGESMNQEVILLTQLVQREADPVARQRLLQMYCSKMARHGRPGHYLIVTDESGGILAANVDGDRAEQVVTERLLHTVPRADATQPPTSAIIDGIDTLEVMTRFEPTDQGKGAILYYSEPLAGVYRTVSHMLSLRLLFLGSALLVTFGCLWLMVRRKVSDPLWQLYLGQLDVWEGARNHLRAPGPDNEIAQLYTMHNAMVDKLIEHETALVGATNAAEAGRMARKLTHDIKQDTSDLMKSLQGLVAGKALESGQVRVALGDVAGIADREQKILTKLTDFELIASGSHDVLVEEESHLLENEQHP